MKLSGQVFHIYQGNSADKEQEEKEAGCLEEGWNKGRKTLRKSNMIKRKILASILGIFGISLIIVSSKITGAIIGAQEKDYYWIFGILMMIVAFFIFLSSKKKTNRKHKQ
jgi:uncharacterized membrane protein